MHSAVTRALLRRTALVVLLLLAGLVLPTAPARAYTDDYPWKYSSRTAVDAFGRNGFFVLVGDRQVEDLDEELTLDEAAHVAFIRLVQLVGG